MLLLVDLDGVVVTVVAAHHGAAAARADDVRRLSFGALLGEFSFLFGACLGLGLEPGTLLD